MLGTLNFDYRAIQLTPELADMPSLAMLWTCLDHAGSSTTMNQGHRPESGLACSVLECSCSPNKCCRMALLFEVTDGLPHAFTAIQRLQANGQVQDCVCDSL